MKLKKPNFWSYKRPNLLSYLLFPISLLIQIANYFKFKSKNKLKIKTICVGNIYLGGTGKTSLSIKINEILSKKNVRSCFIKKYYKNQIDEQELLKERGKVFSSSKRLKAIQSAENENYEVGIFDDGLQDGSISYDLSIVCFNNINWIGNGMTIPSGPLREKISNLKNYNHIFLNGNLENTEYLKKKILQINPKINIHIGIYHPINIEDFSKKNKYLVFSGIGNHLTFISMIKENGLSVIKDIEFPDHYKFKDNDLNKILHEAEKLNCKVITTEKDYFRIAHKYKEKIKFLKSDLRIVNEEKLTETILNI